MMQSEKDWRRAIEQTFVVRFPKQTLATFGSTNIAYYVVTEPVYQEMPGWKQPTASTTVQDQLPREAVDYVRRIEELVGCPVHMISTGPRREETILVKPFM